MIKIIAEARFNDRAEKIIYDVMEKLSSNGDEILSVLNKLVMLEKRGLLDELLKLAELVTNLVTMAQETVDSEIEELITKNTEILMSIGILLANDKVKKLVNAIEEATLDLEYETAGLMDLLKAMREPEVKKAIGFLIGFLRELGKRL